MEQLQVSATFPTATQGHSSGGLSRTDRRPDLNHQLQ
jgi:hypothetical protein